MKPPEPPSPLPARSRSIFGLALIVFGVFGLSATAEGQFFGVCDSGEVRELQESIRAHQEHVLRLSTKFEDVWYLQGKLPRGFRPAPGLESVHRFLRQLVVEGRRPGVVFYSYAAERGRPPAADNDGAIRLCSWLMTASAPMPYPHVARLDMTTLTGLQARLRVALGVAEPARPGAEPVDLDSVLLELSELLLPKPISEAILRDAINTLVVVPVTITIPRDEGSQRRTTELVAAVGTIPFSLLRVGMGERRDKSVLDVASVVIAPGFAALAEPRIAPPGVPLEPIAPDSEWWRPSGAALTDIGDAIVVGDPTNRAFRRLREARQEAEEVAASVGSRAVVGEAATKGAVLSRLRTGQDRTGLVYLATHGVANEEENPLDRSFLVMSDALLTAREISTLRFTKRPLVVMSACESGLGRNFEVGTIGLARAWQRAGASKVVMSLWRIDDSATRRLMTDFVRLLKDEPADIALRHVMRRYRDVSGNPAHWAGFALFGLP